MFGGRKISSLKSLERWELFKIKSLEGMFRKCEFLNGLEGIENWNLFSCKNIKDMFYQCKGIKSLVSLKYWDTSKIENMSRLFYGNDLESLQGLENWNLTKCINFNEIFKDCKLIEDLSPIKNWLIPKYQQFSSTFRPMPIKINYGNLFGPSMNDEILKSMASMFENCSSIKSVIPIENWEITAFNNFNYLFKNCKSIEDFSPLSKWKFRSSKETTDIFVGTNQKGVNQVNIKVNIKGPNKKTYGNLFG